MKIASRLVSLAVLALAACVAQPQPSKTAIRLEGAVAKSFVEWSADFTAYELLTQPGVLSASTKTPSIEIHRTVDGSPLVIPVDLARINAGDSSSNVLLQPGDLVRVTPAK